MLPTDVFCQELKDLGFSLFIGVPCSFLKDLINFAINECHYVAATNEGDAVAIATGTHVGGKRSVVLMQNSGLTNAVSPLTSLNYVFRLPVLGFVSLRGQPGLNDEPQHELMGKITCELLDLMSIPWEFLSGDLAEARQQLRRANEAIANDRSFVFIVRKDTFMSVVLRPPMSGIGITASPACRIDRTEGKGFQLPTRAEVIRRVCSLRGRDTLVLATTGMTGRELYDIEDAPNHFYMVGSMGCVNSFGLGLAMARPDKLIIVLDGDGALLMRMGSLATIGNCSPPNMLHVVLNNRVYDSTGGQATVSDTVNFVDIAAACGYSASILIRDLDHFTREVSCWKSLPALTLLHVRISPGSGEGVGRPKESPAEIKSRFMRFLDEQLA